MKHAKEDNEDNIENKIVEETTVEQSVNNKEIPKRVWIILYTLSFIIILIAVSCFVTYKITYTEEYANKRMTELVTEYFERDVKANVARMGRLIVTVKTLEDAGFRIDGIRGIKGKPGVSEDLSKAFSYVIIENIEETDPTKIIYTIENHLSGE